MLDEKVTTYLSAIGKKGGQSRSQKKIDAGRKNIEKATQERLKKINKKSLDKPLV